MSSVRFLPEGETIIMEGKKAISDIALSGGISIPYACGKTGRCSTCRCSITNGLSHLSARTNAEQRIAEKMGFGPDVRLACQTFVNGDVEVLPLITDKSLADFSSIFVKSDSSDELGIEKHMFILFADVRDFTALSETFLPYDVIYVLNYYFHEMTQVIERNGGTIDNYMGDALLALFESDNPQDGAQRATRAALEMLTTIRTLVEPNLQNLINRQFRIGIGLHYGLVVAGKIGGYSNKRATVIGDAVNFAARIESANKETDTDFLVSENAYALIKKKASVNNQFKIPLKGKAGKHKLYEIVSLD
jgi:adenylate cyclase